MQLGCSGIPNLGTRLLVGRLLKNAFSTAFSTDSRLPSIDLLLSTKKTKCRPFEDDRPVAMGYLFSTTSMAASPGLSFSNVGTNATRQATSSGN